jgi:hypothetical protein
MDILSQIKTNYLEQQHQLPLKNPERIISTLLYLLTIMNKRIVQVNCSKLILEVRDHLSPPLLLLKSIYRKKQILSPWNQIKTAAPLKEKEVVLEYM